MNMTIKSNDFLECIKPNFCLTVSLKLLMITNKIKAMIGPDDPIVSDANKQFLKSFLTKSNESLVKMMKNEGPVHINYK